MAETFHDPVVDDDFGRTGSQYVHHAAVFVFGKQDVAGRDFDYGRVVRKQFEKNHVWISG